MCSRTPIIISWGITMIGNATFSDAVDVAKGEFDEALTRAIPAMAGPESEMQVKKSILPLQWHQYEVTIISKMIVTFSFEHL
jgi:hypothetical protein